MEALWLEKQSLSYRAQLADPGVPMGEALVKVRLAGVCSTDLEMVRGYYPFTGIPGHEFVGEVVQVNSPEEAAAWVGRRVVGEINVSCGACEACLRGYRTHCERREALGIKNRSGCFAGFLALPLQNLHPVPDQVSDEAAVFTEPLAAALEIQEQVHISPGQRVLVVGAGRLGQLIAQTLSLTGCSLKVVVRHPKPRLLLESRGIPAVTEDQVETGRSDLVVEATGSPEGFALARRAVRPRGTIVLKSTYRGDQTANFSALVVDEITLIGSRCGPFPPALRLLETRKVDPTPLIDARYPLFEGVQALDHAAQPGTLKILLQPEQ